MEFRLGARPPSAAAWSRAWPPALRGNQSRRTFAGDADDLRAPLRFSEGVGGGKKYEQSLEGVAVIRVPSPLRGLTDGIQCR